MILLIKAQPAANCYYAGGGAGGHSPAFLARGEPSEFVPLPLDFFLLLTLLTMTYLLVVQVAKRRLMRRWLGE
jgi:hypothetical protein